MHPSELPARRGGLDTSVLIDHDLIAPERLPDESAITAVTLAELAAGLLAWNGRERES